MSCAPLVIHARPHLSKIVTIFVSGRGQVSNLCFTDSGRLIVSVGMDKYNSVFVHRVDSGCLVACGKGERRHITDLAVWVSLLVQTSFFAQQSPFRTTSFRNIFEKPCFSYWAVGQ